MFADARTGYPETEPSLVDGVFEVGVLDVGVSEFGVCVAGFGFWPEGDDDFEPQAEKIKVPATTATTTKVGFNVKSDRIIASSNPFIHLYKRICATLVPHDTRSQLSDINELFLLLTFANRQ